MSSRLHSIGDWPALAHASRYNCEALAALCGVSERQLERFFLSRFSMRPKGWMHSVRMKRALEMIQQGFSTKALANDLFFKSASHFCRAFKKYFGKAPQFYAPAPRCRILSTMSHSAHSPLLKPNCEARMVGGEEPKVKSVKLVSDRTRPAS